MVNQRLKRSTLLGKVAHPSLREPSTNASLNSFRDNPDVDIVGANMYHSLLQQEHEPKTSLSGYDLLTDPVYLSARSCESILVCTGVYNSKVHRLNDKEGWKMPTVIQEDVLEAVKYILNKENQPWN